MMLTESGGRRNRLALVFRFCEMKMIDIDTGTEELLCRIEDRVAVVTLNKPHKKNALGDVLTPALRSVMLVLADDERVGCVMITGAGDAFCSGGDVSGMGGVERPNPGMNVSQNCSKSRKH